MSTATDNEQTITDDVVDITPSFMYSKHVEILKRFLEQVSAHMGQSSDDQMSYIENNLDHVRVAMQEVLTRDIENQIKDGRFPIVVPQFQPHEYQPGAGTPVCRAYGSANTCKGKTNAPEHSL